jgi:hypothetical protein
VPDPGPREDVDVDAVPLPTGAGWRASRWLPGRVRRIWRRSATSWVARGLRARRQGVGRSTCARLGGQGLQALREDNEAVGPASVNQALAAIDNFYRSLGAGRPQVAREDLAQTAPRALDEAEQRRETQCRRSNLRTRR